MRDIWPSRERIERKRTSQRAMSSRERALVSDKARHLSKHEGGGHLLEHMLSIRGRRPALTPHRAIQERGDLSAGTGRIGGWMWSYWRRMDQGRESSSRIQSSTWTTEYSRGPVRMTTRSIPALMITRRHMEQEVASWRSPPSLASRPAR